MSSESSSKVPLKTFEETFYLHRGNPIKFFSGIFSWTTTYKRGREGLFVGESCAPVSVCTTGEESHEV